MKTFVKIIAIILLVFGAIVTLLGIGLIIDNPNNDMTLNIIMVSIFGGIPVLGGVLILSYQRNKTKIKVPQPQIVGSVKDVIIENQNNTKQKQIQQDSLVELEKTSVLQSGSENNTNVIKKTFLTTKDDLVLFYKAVNYKYRVPVICLFIIIISILTMALKWDVSIFLLSLGMSLVIVAGVIILAFSPYTNAKKTLEQNVLFQHDISIELSNEGMKRDSYNFNIFLKWEDVYCYFESKKTFAIFISQEMGYVIPKRIFSEEEVKEVSQLLKDKIIPPQKKKKNNKQK